MVCIIQVVGFSGSGKTSSIVLASLKLKSLGFRVAVIKHTHHDVDSPHRDSWRFVEEGLADYSVVFKGSGERVAIIMRDRSLSDVINNI
ncbi:MAG: molybdopterin-guanine dinucleotide biosynthesis protein MobB, partial [Acidilobaceae archaeon]